MVTPEQAAARSPVRTSANGNGWGFIDQNGALVLVLANAERGESTVQVDLTGVVDGTYSVTDALTGAVATTATVAGGRTRFTINIGDYDTRVLVFPAAAVAAS